MDLKIKIFHSSKPATELEEEVNNFASELTKIGGHVTDIKVNTTYFDTNITVLYKV